MQEKILFKEEQQFRQKWLWVVIIAVNISFITVLLFPGIWNRNVSPLGIVVLLLIDSIFWFEKLKTTITDKGIHYSFTILPFTSRFKSWAEINSAYIRQYKPILEYGGWGLRWG